MPAMTMNPASQRDFMRTLIGEIGRNKPAVCAAYAQAERDGRVGRAKDAHDTSPEAYAEALWNDGDRKGWF
jgi:hypothetical protein